ncbi:MAG: aldose 1-epimerase family protein [Paraclostridium sp.]
MQVLENNNLILEVKSKGAELCRLFSKKNNTEFLWHGDTKYWGRHSPILFPIVGRLKDNETFINNVSYNMNQHGFARDMEFKLIESTSNSISYKLTDDEESKQKYPYSFELIIKYIILDSSVKVEWFVQNTNECEMFFSIGAHPAFNVPFNNNEDLSEYYLDLKLTGEVNQYLLEGPFVSNIVKTNDITKLDIKPELFINDALIYDNIESIAICSRKNDSKVNVSFKDFPLVGIWSPYYSETNSIAPFICIEPWHGIADKFDTNKNYNTKFGINKLAPNEIFSTSYSIEII